MNHNSLAIIIPAYKGRFLNRALESIVAQTDQRFRVYVGDDASPDDIAKICNCYADKTDIRYHRFAHNVGGSSLVEQWNRCIKLSSEDWIWLFSDDDVMDPECVAAFHETLETSKKPFDLYRFHTCTIDAAGKVVTISPPHPVIETSIEFTYHRLCGNRSSYACEYIFSRETFDRNHGLVDFPFGWCADDATWIVFGEKTGICTIPGPKVGWRNSGENVSRNDKKFRQGKIEASILFLQWLETRFEDKVFLEQLGIAGQDFQACKTHWLYKQIGYQAPLFPLLWVKFARKNIGFGKQVKCLLKLALIDMRYFSLTLTSFLLRQKNDF